MILLAMIVWLFGMSELDKAKLSNDETNVEIPTGPLASYMLDNNCSQFLLIPTLSILQGSFALLSPERLSSNGNKTVK